jgi:hypothetical protein
MARSLWWTDWPFSRVNENLSILDVLKTGEMDPKLAGLLWLLMEHRASVLVAAGPSFAGKTTLLHSLLDFLPPGIRQIGLSGFDRNFTVLGDHKPEKSYLVAEEISPHQYEYLWGYQVARVFELLKKGYALGGTIHARNVREVVYVLNALGVPLPTVAKLDIVVTLHVRWGERLHEDDLIRRVDTVSLINHNDKGLVAQMLAGRQSTDGDFIYPSEKVLHDILFSKFAFKYENIFSEVERRERFLRELSGKDASDREDVKKAITGFYRSYL